MLSLRRSLRLGQYDEVPQDAGPSWEEKYNTLNQWADNEIRRAKEVASNQIAQYIEIRLDEISRAIQPGRTPNLEMATGRINEIRQYLKELSAPIIETDPTMENLGLRNPDDE